jgi:hypothetical protein
MTSVAASILSTHVHDPRFRALHLDLEGGDERVFSVDHHMLGSALQLQSDSELQGTLLARSILPRPRPAAKRDAPASGNRPPRRKAFWPTIPQLYVKGEFVGGCDIVREMLEAGELTAMLDEKGVAYDKTQLLA